MKKKQPKTNSFWTKILSLRTISEECDKFHMKQIYYLMEESYLKG